MTESSQICSPGEMRHLFPLMVPVIKVQPFCVILSSLVGAGECYCGGGGAGAKCVVDLRGDEFGKEGRKNRGI